MSGMRVTGISLRSSGLRSITRALIFRQRNEFGLVRHRRESTRLPILFRLLDAFFARGDEIPPDVARPLQGGAAEEHEPRAPQCAHGDPVAGTEDQKPR